MYILALVRIPADHEIIIKKRYKYVSKFIIYIRRIHKTMLMIIYIQMAHYRDSKFLKWD